MRSLSTTSESGISQSKRNPLGCVQIEFLVVSQRFYEDEEAQEILRRAAGATTDHANGISRDNLLLSAAELGIAPEALAEAERSVIAERSQNALHAEYVRELRHDFAVHLASYVIINGGFLLMNLFLPFFGWVYWSIFGWGIGLVFDALATYGPESRRDSPEFQKWVRKKAKRARRSAN